MPWSRWSDSAAIASDGMLPSCQLRISRYFAPCRAVATQVSVVTRIKVSGVSVMVPSNGACIGVTPNGVAGSSSPSMRSATAAPITFDAKMSVPVGRCGPCCSTLPAGRITSGLRLSWAAISGWVRSMKWRLGNMDFPFGHARPRLLDHVGDAHARAIALDRAQRRIDHRDRDIAVARIEQVGAAGDAAFGEHLQLGAEHVALRNFQLLAPT